MKWQLIGVLIALPLAACASDPVAGLPIAGADPACGEVASARMHDAAINGLDSQLQTVVWRDAYKTCLEWKKKAGVAGR